MITEIALNLIAIGSKLERGACQMSITHSRGMGMGVKTESKLVHVVVEWPLKYVVN